MSFKSKSRIKYFGYLLLICFVIPTVALLIKGISIKNGGIVANTCIFLGIEFSILLSMLTHDDVKKIRSTWLLIVRILFILISGATLYEGLSLGLWLCGVPVSEGTFQDPNLTREAIKFFPFVIVFALYTYYFYKHSKNNSQ